MRIISQKKIKDFYIQPKYENVKTFLQQWYYMLQFRVYNSFAQLLEDFRDTVRVNGLYIFNIDKGAYKIATSICFDTGCVYVRFVGITADYDSFIQERIQNGTT